MYPIAKEQHDAPLHQRKTITHQMNIEYDTPFYQRKKLMHQMHIEYDAHLPLLNGLIIKKILKSIKHFNKPLNDNI
jgi:hypothetical protein